MTTPWTLADLEAAIRAGWSAETSEPAGLGKVPWTPENPAWGQCDITALVVQDLVGGDLVLGEVLHDGRPEGYHWWNLLPGGVRVDLTWEQFRRGETVTPGRVVKRPGGRLGRRWEEDHWGDWLGVRQPTLLVRGDRSGVLSAEHAREMTVRRAGVRMVELPAGHAVRAGDPEGYFAAVRGFLTRVA
ncbi:alpha/beta fold hydrolase [Streptomyces sp. NRRL F-2580]|uniref:alpha/beta fold hydrolase n=1 Tax=Streptomyces sp. NRRL F-2580 TaxID=1463841 RepID=UPI0007C4404D|nr:hypothetical protein [Streptomyces sp. NRRL F-2580]